MYIDPKKLSLQDAAGMQLAEIIRKIPEGGGGSGTPYDETPAMDGVGDAGSSTDYARGDHVHPSDTSKADVSDIPAGSDANPQSLGVASAGVSGDFSRADHIHAMPAAADVGAIAANQGSANAGKVLGVGNDGSVSPVPIEDNIYVATAFQTSVTDIETAYQAGKKIMCADGDTLYPLISRTAPAGEGQNPSFRFSLMSFTDYVSISCAADSTWSRSTLVMEAGDIDAAQEIEVVTVATDGAVSQMLNANTIYDFTGNLTSLTIGLVNTAYVPQYHFSFNSGATPVVLASIAGVTLPDGFSVAANKHYEVDILNGYGVVSEWATT